ncbi:MAG: hypothetical protein HN576_07810 [Bacteriovoracaceae bacterium]|jgi:hypothetical protein|nr:hypothetical protein [Bacteriovoracaceae bacterium]
MELRQCNNQSEKISGGFKGLLTKLLAEAFIEEEILEPMPKQASIKSEKELNLFLRQFAKPFT